MEIMPAAPAARPHHQGRQGAERDRCRSRFRSARRRSPSRATCTRTSTPPITAPIWNATRQRKHFDDPDLFDLDSAIPPSLRRLPFGAGAHACIGASLALAEARHVLGAIAALDGRLTILERRRNRGKIYPGYTRLLMRLEDRPAP